MSKQITGQWALVTGASSGLGVDFAKQLAAKGANLVLTARRVERLEAVRDEIQQAHDVQIEVIPCDLAAEGAPQELYDAIQAKGLTIDILINNAGLGLYGAFTEIEWEREKAMLDLDIITLTHMTKLFVKDMVAQGSGHILQVASIGAYQPSPLYASYSAAKSYVLNFSQAINYELRNTGVSVTVISPGVTKTEFLEVSGQEPTLYQRMVMMSSEDVTRQGINAMLKGKAQVVPGFLNALTAWSTRIMPRRLAAAVAYHTMR